MPKFSMNMKPMFGDEFRDSGVVHDVVYHTWSREVANAYGDQLGGQQVEGRPTPVKMEINYSSPLLVTEEAKVTYGVTKIGRSSVTYETQINETVSGRPIATMTMVAVMIDNNTGKSIPVPEENKKLMIDFEGKENVQVK